MSTGSEPARYNPWLSQAWAPALRTRTLAAFDRSTSECDRLALLRTLAWLSGGRFELDDYELSGFTDEGFERFGLARIGPSAIRIRDDDGPSWWPQIHVDSQSRRYLEEGVGDGILRRLTSLRGYRSLSQKAAVRALFTAPAGSGLLVSLPTGAGKSLMFQLAALHGREAHVGSCVVVVTPTIALALDHERTLRGIPGLEGSRALIGDLGSEGIRDVVDAFRRGEIPILLLGPELALRSDIVSRLVEVASPEAAAFGLNGRLTHLFVDEAHIIESWGRSFRPDFQRLPGLLAELRQSNPDVRAVLLSATMPPSARAILRRDWSLTGEWLEIDARVPRYEHDIVVSQCSSDEERQEALSLVVDRAPRPAIIYTTEVVDAERIFKWLSDDRGYQKMALFTGDTGSADRRRIIEDWSNNHYDLIVATSAFGIGIDKADVRSVIHACLPESAARWYQEIGRAARDGGQAFAALLFTGSREGGDDVSTARRMAVGGWLTRELAEKRWAAMRSSATDQGWVGGKWHMSVDLNAIREGLRPESTDYNRNWNMALLTLLQRARAISIKAVKPKGGDEARVWEIEISDGGLLSDDPTSAWDKIYQHRDREVANARDELTPWLNLVRKPLDACMVRTAFELIEPNTCLPNCGRCPHCRDQMIRPPRHVEAMGLESAWQETPAFDNSKISHGVHLVEPVDRTLETNLPALVHTITSIGIQQFVVDAELAEGIADALGQDAQVLGIILTLDEWTEGRKLANLPTALFVSPDERNGWHVERFVQWAKDAAFTSIVVARRDRQYRGRRFDQWVSRHAPISQEFLMSLAGG